MRKKIHNISRALRLTDLFVRRLRGFVLKNFSENMLMVVIAIIIGIFSGALATAMRTLISYIYQLCSPDTSAAAPDYFVLIYPVAGIIITALFQRYVVGYQCARGTYIIKTALNKKEGSLNSFLVFDPLIGCSVTIGMGASSGTEGPIALCAAAAGSNIADFFHLSPNWKRNMIIIGGAAGIAAIFKSPFGGVLFALEVLQMELTSIPVIALILASIVGSATASFLTGFSMDMILHLKIHIDGSMMIWVALLGILAGMYSIFYNFTKNKTADYFRGMKRRWLAALLTGALMSAAVFLIPALFGTGENVMQSLVNGNKVDFLSGGLFTGHSENFIWMIISLISMLLIKGVLVGAAFSGGGVAGDFLPTLFAGSILGFLFATCMNTFFPLTLPEWYFALIGMAAVMAGTIHAPLMAIFILAESTGTIVYLPAYVVAVFICYGTVKFLTPKSWYSETGHDDLQMLKMWNKTPKIEDNRRRDQ